MQRINELVGEGYIRATQHPDQPLTIYNYTPRTQYEDKWTPETLMCRGLILSDDDIIARPFDKFFNWDERGRTTNADIVTVTEKMDGSLGIFYRDLDGQPCIATRGSFDGEQALWATEYLRRHYALNNVDGDYTLLFEIIYPENRVVVDYGGKKGLFLLAARHRFTGEYASFQRVQDFAHRQGFPTPKVYQFNSADEIAEAAKTLDGNQEGWVAEFSDGQRFKFKGDEYVELHRLIHGLSFKRVLEAVQQGKGDEYVAKIPEEFRDQAEEWLGKIKVDVAVTYLATLAAYDDAPKGSRKEFALWVQANAPDLAPYLFAKYDGKDFRHLIYKREF